MTVSSYKVFDSDMHVQEPWDLWLNYIEPKYRSRAPVGTNEYFTDVYLKHDGKLISRLDHQHTHEDGFVRDMCAQHGRLEIFEDYDERGWSSECQLDAMEREGIDVAVLFPTRGLFAHAKIYDDDRLAAAVSRAYNNWLVEFCSIAPERMYGAAMLPVQDVGAAVAEARRAKEELGFPAVFIRPRLCKKSDLVRSHAEIPPQSRYNAVQRTLSRSNSIEWLVKHFLEGLLVTPIKPWSRVFSNRKRASCPHHLGNQCTNTQHIDDTQHIVGKNMKTHLRTHLGQRLHQKVRRPHPRFEGAEWMLHRLTPSLHHLRCSLQPGFSRIRHRFVLPATDAPVITTGALRFHRTPYACRTPVPPSLLSRLFPCESINGTLTRRAQIFVIFRNVEKVALPKLSLGQIARRLRLR